jgi:tripartite-type tricarboxylate transporter receptor subunit TctC
MVKTPARRIIGVVAAACLSVAANGARARADDVETFYKGKTIELYVGFFVGAGYDQRARLLARHMGQYIPGNPNIIVRNMGGAGSLKLANWLKKIAPRDGSVFGMIGRGAGFDPLLGVKAAQFSGPEFNWIGTPSGETYLCAVLASTGVKRFEDTFTHKVIVGSVGTGDSGEIPGIMNAMFGSKFELVSGYKVTGDVSLAMERGEVQGRCGWAWSALKATHQRWIDEKKLNLLVQFNRVQDPELPQVPIIFDFAHNDKQRKILNLIFSRQDFGWPFLAPPGVPADRVVTLRKAFMAAMADKTLQTEAAKEKIDIAPVSGEKLQQMIAEIYDSPADIVQETKRLMPNGH